LSTQNIKVASVNAPAVNAAKTFHDHASVAKVESLTFPGTGSNIATTETYYDSIVAPILGLDVGLKREVEEGTLEHVHHKKDAGRHVRI
jgi:hypothetical protein